MATLPGIEGEFYFGFSREIPSWRGTERQQDPAVVSSIIGFPTADLDKPADSPAILVRRARKHSGPHDLIPAFETAAALPDWMPPQLHADAWQQAHRIAAGAALEQPAEAESLQTLARGALKFARKFMRRRGVHQSTPENEVLAEPFQEVQEAPLPVQKPIRRWKDSRGFVHSPKAPKETCKEQSPGPRGGRIWDCGGAKDGKSEKPPQEKPQATPEAETPPSQEETSPAAPKSSPTVESASKLIQHVRGNPTAEKVAALASMLATMKKEDLRQLKRLQGVRADDNTKIGLAKKIAKAATVRLTQRAYWEQEARKVGVRPEDMLLAAKDMRETYGRTADMVNKLVVEARESYAKQFGKLITRRMKAFDGGDYDQIPGFDVLARQMAGQYPELLGAHGYTSEGGADENASEAAQKLFTLFAAGRQSRMSFGESQRQALDVIKSGQRKPVEEAMPFQKRGEVVHA
jgi:hypothetical protein